MWQNYFEFLNWFRGMKITLNSVTFAPLVENLWKDVPFTYFANGHDPCRLLLHVKLILRSWKSMWFQYLKENPLPRTIVRWKKLHVHVKLAKLCPLSSTTPLPLLKAKYVKFFWMLKEDYEVGIMSCES